MPAAAMAAMGLMTFLAVYFGADYGKLNGTHIEPSVQKLKFVPSK